MGIRPARIAVRVGADVARPSRAWSHHLETGAEIPHLSQALARVEPPLYPGQFLTRVTSCVCAWSHMRTGAVHYNFPILLYLVI